MSQIPPAMAQKYLAAWKEAAVLLEEVRARELPLIDTTRGLLSLLPAFDAMVKHQKPSDSSGLFEQQRIFSRAIKK